MLSATFLANTWTRLPPDARETVTYYSKVGEAFPVTGQSVPNAHRKVLEKEIIGSNEELAKNGIGWDMWASQMAGVTWGGPSNEPKRGDKFVDGAGNVYIVFNVGFLDLSQRYELTCVRAQRRAT